MNKFKNTIRLIIILLITFKANCQTENKAELNNLITSFENLSSKKANYELEYVGEKKTFYFKFKIEKSEEITYKVIKSDMHPEGIFLFKSKDGDFIRILSIDNGHRFIREKFINGFRLSHTTNLIDIRILSNSNQSEIDTVIANLKNVLKKIKPEIEEIQIFVAPESETGN